MPVVDNSYDLLYDAIAMRGHFITFEGGEGCGKTTQLAILADYLEKKGRSLVRTREPGGTKLADKIRTLILGGTATGPPIAPKAELFLYLASRAQHMDEVILPALKAGKLVLCDRFTDATIAYQGGGRGLAIPDIEGMAKFATQDTEPDLTFLLQMDVRKALARLKARGEINRIDGESLQFHEAVQKTYMFLASENPKRIIIVDANDAIEAVSKKIREITNAFLS